MVNFDKNKYYNMPAYFGGADFAGPDPALYYRDSVSLLFTYATDGDRLESSYSDDEKQ